MRFLVDAQLPPALARWIESKDFSAEHVIDIELAAATDSAIWEYAVRVGAVIVTKDEDFAIRRTLSSSGPQIIWIRLGNTTKTQLLHWLDPLFGQILESLQRGEPLVEVT